MGACSLALSGCGSGSSLSPLTKKRFRIPASVCIRPIMGHLQWLSEKLSQPPLLSQHPRCPLASPLRFLSVGRLLVFAATVPRQWYQAAVGAGPQSACTGPVASCTSVTTQADSQGSSPGGRGWTPSSSLSTCPPPAQTPSPGSRTCPCPRLITNNLGSPSPSRLAFAWVFMGRTFQKRDHQERLSRESRSRPEKAKQVVGRAEAEEVGERSPAQGHRGHQGHHGHQGQAQVAGAHSVPHRSASRDHSGWSP